ncbi:MAG: citrate synthase/methylcitrate synthase [Candidatus Micrarchaeota archaeon]|nr:citrate synthase/methylcitrate synthase [Candidatus Micrarchaeota archaeon]
MAEAKPNINLGLEGVYFTESSVCKIDGIAGRLWYRGYPIEELADQSTFEEVSYLLLYGRLPKRKELDDFSSQLAEERALPEKTARIIADMSGKTDPMHVMATAASSLSAYDREADDTTRDANLRKSVRLISKLTSIVSSIGRYSAGMEAMQPDGNMGHIENFLYTLTGRRPSADAVSNTQAMFILQAEHSSNASTFSALVTASTLSDIYSAVTTGINTLKGPLHGEADEAALRMLRAIGTPDNTERYIEEALAGKQRIMGFGHRIYKTYDPRARIIKRRLEALQGSASEEIGRLTQIALRAEKLMIDRLGQSHGIWPNIDFFAGPVYLSAGIPVELFTPIFAASRVSGWCAHILEYWQNNRLIRPLDYYTGTLDLKYVPIDAR